MGMAEEQLQFGRTPPIPLANETWAATDALGRKLPMYEEVGDAREGKYVGVFYYIWHGYHDKQVYDITKLLAESSLAGASAEPNYGPPGAFHYWGEPEAGYYRADDPWVIRRNLLMLSQAGVDFLYFDTTNAFTYLSTVERLAALSRELRAEGIRTPYLAFTTASLSGKTMNELYDNFYAKGLYKDLWFIWDGKPLMLGDKNDPVLSAEARNFFTFRYSWAWTDAANQPDHWQWIDEYPQDYGWHEDPAVPEQVAVSVGSHPTLYRGQSYQQGEQPPLDAQTLLAERTGEGLHLAEQWERALEVDPEVIMVTQWNEWIAQRFVVWESGQREMFLGKELAPGQSFFVDAYNQEFNRDMEPMRGGHTDNHYYQLVANIRRFKGLKRPPDPSEPLAGPFAIDGGFAKWQQVAAVYRDPQGDVLHRDWPGYDPGVHYTDATGRNDIVESRVAYDEENIYFYVATAEPLTPHTDPHWMHLYLDVDRDKATGWEGYDFAVNLAVADSQVTTLSAYINGRWQEQGKLSYRYEGNELELAISREALGGVDLAQGIEFKWADNIQRLYDITAFFVHGDVAPDRRANYVFVGK